MNFGNRGGQTIRITFRKDDKEWKTLFGNSYKFWYTQAVEYIYRNHGSKTKGWRFEDIEGLEIVEVERSRSPWIGWGGLKWCDEKIFQQELNREGVQRDEPDNPKARQYADFRFHPYPYGRRKLMAELRGW